MQRIVGGQYETCDSFDVSMGKSYMVIYNGLKKCIFEGEIKHTKPEFEKLRHQINELIEGYGEHPILCLSQLVSIHDQ